MADERTTTLATADIQRIMALLPHRYPFLMVDRIVEIDGDLSGIGIKNVTANEPHFLGHFPDQPIMPGVLIIEGMAPTAGAMCIAASDAGDKTKYVYFLTIDSAKFRKPVVPGDRLEYHVRKLRHRGNIWKYAAEAKVDGQKVAEAELSAMLVSD